MSILIPVSLLLCMFFMSCGGLGLNTGSCIEKERQALIDVKANLTVAGGLGILDGWGSKEGDMDCCKWIGVRCDNLTGHVIELEPPWEGVGKISPSLQELTQLRYLSLSYNDFQCNPLPSFLGSLSNLQILNIFSANLCGHIPHQLANLSNLLVLDLNNNSLAGFIPYSFGDLTSLIRLDLSQNQLGGVIPNSFENFSSLAELVLSQNKLGGVIPKSIGNLSSLTYLDMSQNYFSGPLPRFVGCSSLIYMYLAHNSLNGSMPDLTRCISLKTIDLSSNFLSKTISNSVLQFSNLEYLSLSHNSLNGILPNFMGCPSLSYLNMSGNQFSGNVPNSLGQLSDLGSLDFSSNSLEGVISEVHFLNLTNLAYLDLSLNSLSLDLRFHGESPFQLFTIKLRSCKLGPKFPKWIRTQKYMQHLDISNAGISDNMPTWFSGLLSELYFMNLSSNEIKGILPNMSNIGSSVYNENLFGMDLSYNYFEGKLPLLPPKLAALNLSGNRFSGTLSFLCEIEEFLSFLDLSNNSFSGSLPDCWLKFQKTLVVLNLSNNNLSGKIPSSLGLFPSLEAMYLRSNAFVGEVPLSLSNCTRLKFLDLWGNQLSTFIPEWIGEVLSELYVLNLGSNRFYGRLPSQLCWLHNLQVLDLSNNGLSGNILGCFDNFTAMARRNFTNDMSKHSYSSYLGITNRVVYCGEIVDDGCPGGSVEAHYVDNAWVRWKGKDRSFGGSGLQLLKSIDLSRNNLSGKVPDEITSLYELVSLNLSSNKLHGEVPKDIGQLKQLDSLDLSRNKFSGRIPSSLSKITFLSYLDLSFNNFSGRIPSGPQLQRFDNTSYKGNPQLCGPPLITRCGISPVFEKKAIEEDEDDFWRPYYTGMCSGFAVGFLGICGAITVSRRCRYIIFVSLSYIKDWIYVTVIVYLGKLGRKFRR